AAWTEDAEAVERDRVSRRPQRDGQAAPEAVRGFGVDRDAGVRADGARLHAGDGQRGLHGETRRAARGEEPTRRSARPGVALLDGRRAAPEGAADAAAPLPRR